MNFRKWLSPSSIAEAINCQKLMASHVEFKEKWEQPIRYIAGMDVSNRLFDPKQMIYAATVVLSYPSLSIVETISAAEKQTFPYRTGLLGFREAPALVNVFDRLSCRPDVVMVDGHGVSHPRGLGIASHLGVLLNLPTIGVAKSILIGKPAGVLGEEVGSTVPLLWKGQTIAVLFRSKKKCAPLVISAGHRMTLETAVKLVADCMKGYRLPEVTRQAHLAANACRKELQMQDSAR